MKYLLLAGAIALAGCGTSSKPRMIGSIPIDAHGCAYHDINAPTTKQSTKDLFDGMWGPEMRHSAGYLDAQRRERAGDCEATFDYLNPGKRQSPEYAEMMRKLDERSAKFDLDMRIHDLEMQVLLDQNDVYVSPYSYRPYHSYYPRRH